MVVELYIQLFNFSAVKKKIEQMKNLSTISVSVNQCSGYSVCLAFGILLPETFTLVDGQPARLMP